MLAAAVAEGPLFAAHDLSTGAWPRAREYCLRGGTAHVRMPGDPFTALFSESAGRAWWRCARARSGPSGGLAEAHGRARRGHRRHRRRQPDSSGRLRHPAEPSSRRARPDAGPPVRPRAARLSGWLARCLPAARISADGKRRAVLRAWTLGSDPEPEEPAHRGQVPACTRWPRRASRTRPEVRIPPVAAVQLPARPGAHPGHAANVVEGPTRNEWIGWPRPLDWVGRGAVRCSPRQRPECRFAAYLPIWSGMGIDWTW